MSQVRTGIFYTGEEYRVVVIEDAKETRSVLFRSVYSKEEGEKLVQECAEYIKDYEVRFTFDPIQFHYRTLEIPFKSARKIMQVLPVELEQYVPIPGDEMVTGFYLMGGDVLGIAIKKSILKEHVEFIDSQGFMADVFTDPAGAFVELFQENGALLIWERRFVILIVRKDDGIQVRVVPLPGSSEDIYRVAREVRRSVQSSGLTEGKVILSGAVLTEFRDATRVIADILNISVEEAKSSTFNVNWPYDEKEFHRFLLPCAIAAQDKVYNFRRGEFAPVFTKGLPVRELRMLGVFLLIGLLMLNAGVRVVKKNYSDMVTLLKTRELNIFVDAFPNVKKIVDPYLQMEEKVSRLSSNRNSSTVTFSEFFYTLSKAVRDTHVTLDQVTFFEGDFDIYAYAEEVDLIEAFRKRLSEEKIFKEVKLLLSRREKDRPGFKFRIKGKVKE